jgi:cystathionine beta-lyase
MSSPFERVELADLRTRTSLKWRAYPSDVLPLWVAEMDTVLAEPIVRAVSRAMSVGDTGYPFGTGYAEAMAAFARLRWDWPIDVTLVRPVADVLVGLAEALRLVLRPGDAVVVTPPVYPPFYGLIDHQGFRALTAPLGPNGRLDLDSVERAFSQATEAGGRGALLLANPHNPTGVVHTAGELSVVAALAAAYDIRVVVDEIHAPLTHPGHDFVPYLSVPGGERGFSVISASKGWNLAALKAALLIAGPAAESDLARLPVEVSYGTSGMGMLAHTVALTEAVDWLDEHRRALDDNRRLLSRLLTDRLPLVHYRIPDATFLAWLDCRALGLGDDPAATFLERGLVAFNSGLPFGRGGAGHVRLNFATSPAILTEAVDRMVSAVS